ncbi:MAG: insulinase family protein [Rikenellaceae bacterium]|nr:insulinase family protein [Rikenellaceae bacterium]
MEISRTKQPDIQVPERIDVPVTEKYISTNGIPVHIVNINDTQDIVRISLVFRAGTRFQSYPFQASSTLYLLKEGTKNFTSAEISEKLDFYGAYFDVSIDRDYSIVTVCTLTKFLDRILEIYSDIIANPVFPENELLIYAGKRKQSLRIEREKISHIARELFGKLLFGDSHPYGVASPPEDYDNLTVAKLKEFHSGFYTAGNCFAVISGKINDFESQKIMRFMEAVPSGKGKEFGELSFSNCREHGFIEKEGAVQSAIRIGKVLFNRNHPDFIGMQVLNTILGGYFGSRLIANLREDKGYTYGIYSTMVNLEATGYMAVATEVGADVTDDAVKEIYKEIRRLRDEPVGDTELQIVKNILTGEYLRIIDGPFGIADVTIENIQNGVGNDYINYSLQRIKNITPEELMSLARKYLEDDTFTEAVVGKREL